jgi:hypothetical protein
LYAAGVTRLAASFDELTIAIFLPANLRSQYLSGLAVTPEASGSLSNLCKHFECKTIATGCGVAAAIAVLPLLPITADDGQRQLGARPK